MQQDRLRHGIAAALSCLVVLIVGGCGEQSAPESDESVTGATSVTPSATMAAAPSTSSSSSALQVVGIGDSYMTEQDSGGASFMDTFVASLEATEGRAVELVDLSDNANTTQRVLSHLQTDDAYRAAVAAGDVIVLSVGSNDSDPFGVYPAGICTPDQALEKCLQAYAPDFANNYEAILAEIEKLRAGRATAVRVTSVDNPFVGWSEAPSKSFGRDFYAQVAAAETESACAAAERHHGKCVDYLHVFSGPDGTEDPASYLAADHSHPGDEGIRTIAELLTQLGVPELT